VCVCVWCTVQNGTWVSFRLSWRDSHGRLWFAIILVTVQSVMVSTRSTRLRIIKLCILSHLVFRPVFFVLLSWQIKIIYWNSIHRLVCVWSSNLWRDISLTCWFFCGYELLGPCIITELLEDHPVSIVRNHVHLLYSQLPSISGSLLSPPVRKVGLDWAVT
jgi:hypothetical protein